MLTSTDFFVKFGNVFELEMFSPLESVHTELIEEVRHTDENAIGNKIVYRYTRPPDSWNIGGIWQRPVHVDLTQGSFFAPHRDLFSPKLYKWVRLNCFANNSHPEQCTYIIDGKIQHFEAGRWYVMNPSLIHYSFCFEPNTVHYIVDVDVSDPETAKWLLSKIRHCQRPYDSNGVGYK